MNKLMAYSLSPRKTKRVVVPKVYFGSEPVYFETVIVEESRVLVFNLHRTMQNLREYLHAEIDKMK